MDNISLRCYLESVGGDGSDTKMIYSDHFVSMCKFFECADAWPYKEGRHLMRSTGKKYIGGKKIYEGDLMRCRRYPFYGIAPGMDDYKGQLLEPNYIGQVYYWDDEACFYVRMHVISERVRGPACGMALFDYEDIENVGNIYEKNDYNLICSRM